MKQLFFLLLLLSLNAYCQNNTVTAIYDRYDPYDLINESIQSTLITNNKASSFINHKTQLDPSTVFLDEQDKPSGDKIKIEELFYKNFDQNYILSYAKIKEEYNTLLYDTISSMTWKIGNLEKEILGYKCLEAKTTFRGRNYTAFFTLELPISDGPWKFCGLPGLILEVTEDNGRISYKAFKVAINQTSLKENYNFEVTNAKTWDEIIKSAKIKYRALKNEMEAKYNGRIRANFSNNIEIYDLNE